jgi:hypothetical protein
MRVLLYSAGLCCVRVISCAWRFFIASRSRDDGCFIQCARTSDYSSQDTFAVREKFRLYVAPWSTKHNRMHTASKLLSLIMILLGALEKERSARSESCIISQCSSSTGVLYGAAWAGLGKTSMSHYHPGIMWPWKFI